MTFHVVSMSQHQVLSDLDSEEGCFGVYSTNLLEGVSRVMRRGDYLIRIKKKHKRPVKGAARADKVVVLGPEKVHLELEGA